MELLDRLATAMGTTAADLRLVLAYYGWMLVPVAVGLAIVIVAVVKVLPRQRRREDLSGQDRRVR